MRHEMRDQRVATWVGRVMKLDRWKQKREDFRWARPIIFPLQTDHGGLAHAGCDLEREKGVRVGFLRDVEQADKILREAGILCKYVRHELLPFVFRRSSQQIELLCLLRRIS